MFRFSWILSLGLAWGLLSAGKVTAIDTLEAENPIEEIALEMKVVTRHLNKLQTGKKPTRDKQEEVVSMLDNLIAELEKECAACRGGTSGNKPNRPLADSMIIGGPGGIGDLHAGKDNGKKWGELPPKERERIMQSMTEGFPAHYQTVLERYYRRLAEEKGNNEATAKPVTPNPGGDGADDAPTEKETKSTTKPASK